MQRRANILSENVWRVAAEDYRLPDGRTLRRGQACVAQMSAMFEDETVFERPRDFRPERFLDERTGEPRRYEQFIPFGLGRRACLGEHLARMELFLFLANLLNRYRVSGGEGLLLWELC